jgi:hypothetical protein
MKWPLKQEGERLSRLPDFCDCLHYTKDHAGHSSRFAEGFGGPGRDRTDDLFHAIFLNGLSGEAASESERHKKGQYSW